MPRPDVDNDRLAEWSDQRLDSSSWASDILISSGQTTPPKSVHVRHVKDSTATATSRPLGESRRPSEMSLGETGPGSYVTVPHQNRSARESTASLFPPHAMGSRRYSEMSLSEAALGGYGTPHNNSRHASESMASLLPPPMIGSRRYTQISMSEASLGSYATDVDHRMSTGSLNDEKRAGTIVRLHDRDDVEQWKGIKRYLYFLAPFLILIDVALYLAYLAFRLYCNIDVQRTTGISAGAAWIFLGVEILITIPYLMNNGWAMFALKSRNRPRLRLMGHHDVPTVDIFVTCCKEDNGVIIDTVRAACDQEYPLDKFRVIVLDDGKSAELEQMVHEVSRVWPNLIYLSREKKPGVPHHFKAGNLNYGLDQINLLPGGSAEFVGALDADMVSPLITSLTSARLQEEIT